MIDYEGILTEKIMEEDAIYHGYTIYDRIDEELVNEIIESMREACEKVLDEAAERAEVRRYNSENELSTKTFWIDHPYNLNVEVNKQSILKLKDEL